MSLLVPILLYFLVHKVRIIEFRVAVFRGAVVALGWRCRGAWVALSRRLGGAVVALVWRCRGAVVALGWRFRGVRVPQPICSVAWLLSHGFCLPKPGRDVFFSLSYLVAPLSPSLAFT
jgi:hypothetical protein